MRRLTDAQLYLFVKTPLDNEGEDKRKFFLVELEGEEQISGLFNYRLTLKTQDVNVNFDQMIGKKVTVSIKQHNGTNRYINGIVSRFTQSENDGRFTTYYAQIHPWLWQLTLSSDCKIFQNLSVPEIVEDVFTSLGFTDYENRTDKGTYPPLEYCVQYQETSFNFISRLLESEGIFYFFEHTEDTHVLVMGDDLDVHPTCPGLTTARLTHINYENDDIISKCTVEQQMIPDKYAFEDFNFKTPDTDLFISTDVDTKGSSVLRIYEYPGKFKTRGDGEKIANKRIEGYELPKKIITGEGFCRAFISGHKFNLAEHDRNELNSAYVLHHLSILANQDRYINFFDAFPADMVFRPPLITKKSKIYGTQTAIVVGKANEEIWRDEYGRVKVQFHWDQQGNKNENSSCWIRVAQIWAGKNWGTMFIPRIDTEVIVSFIEGDPDRPVIIGTLYNATNILPYALPEDKNKSTIKTFSTKDGSAGNEICFEDSKGSEELFIHAQKDKKVTVENDRTIEILNDDKTTVTNNREITIKKGNDILTVDKGNRTINVNAGNENHTNKANYTQDVTGNFSLNVTGNLTIDVKGVVTIKGSLIKLN